MQRLIDSLIYLDSDFVSSIYEAAIGESPRTRFTNTQGRKGDNTNAFFSHVESAEIREFEKSSHEMLVSIMDELEKYPHFDPLTFRNYEGTTVGWFVGRFTMGEWTHTVIKGDTIEKSRSDVVYEIFAEPNNYTLLAQPHLFTANIGSLIDSSPAIRANIGIPVRTLGRVLYLVEDANRFVVSPYLVLES
jgi:hypothetical protein